MFHIDTIIVNKNNQIVQAKGPNVHIDFGPRYSFVCYQDETHHHSRLVETPSLLKSLGQFHGEVNYIH